MSNEVIIRSTIEAIVGHRNHALELYADAFEKIRAADEALSSASSAARAACDGVKPSLHGYAQAPEVDAFHNAVKLPDADQFLRVAKRLTDAQVWASLIERTDMDHLMDKTAKDELRAQMTYVPEVVDRESGRVINEEEIARGLPEVSVDVVESTLRGLVEDSGAIFRRGLATAFATLDRRFRSHDGFKVGSRLILDRAFDDWGHWNHYRNQRDSITDVERVFLVLDGKKPRASYAGIVGTIEADRKIAGSTFGALKQTNHEGDYFRVRIFKNGNAHLWFTRKDLVVEANKLLAEHYGAAVGDGPRDPDPDAAKDVRAVGQARNLGFFPTPEAVADRVIEEACIGDGMAVLEPSAGTGCLAAKAAACGARVDCVELDPDRGRILSSSGSYGRVWAADFLSMVGTTKYDRVVMNPPFDRGRDIDHVLHAWKFVAPGGKLVAVMSAGTEFRSDKKTEAFRKWVKSERGRWYDLPPGSFSEVGTNVNTILLTISRR